MNKSRRVMYDRLAKLTEPLANERGEMSRGCLVGIILLGVVVLVILVGMGIVYFYRDELHSYSARQLLSTGEKVIIDAKPQGYTEQDIHRVFRFSEIAIDSSRISFDETAQLSDLLMKTLQTDPPDSAKARVFMETLIAASDADTVVAVIVDSAMMSDTLNDSLADSLTKLDSAGSR